MKKNEIWSFKNLDEYFDPKFGLVYKDFGNNAFEIILCSTDYDHLSMEDIIIPTEHSDLQYSLVVHSDMIFQCMTVIINLTNKLETYQMKPLDRLTLLEATLMKTQKQK